MSWTRTQLESWLKTIDVKAGRVLDIGGGANPVKDRVKSWAVGEYKICDSELEEMVVKPDWVCDINYFCVSQSMKNYFDIVFFLEVLEYVWRPDIALKNCYEFLKSSGFLYLSVPFLYPHHNPEGKDFLRYTKWGIEKLLTEAGFKIEELKPRIMSDKSTGHWSNFVQNEGMHPCRGYKHNEIGYLVKAIKL